MGDYYKYKKILVILMIVSCGFSIIKNIFKTKVQASEAVEVTPVWNDGNYTYQADNQILTLRQNQIDIQDSLINFFYNFRSNANDTQKANARNTLLNIKQNLITSIPGSSGWGGDYTRMIWFGRVTESVNGSNDYGYCYQITSMAFLNNIVYADATLNSGYKILSVPFYSFTRSSGRPFRFVNVNTGEFYSVNSGEALIPVPEVGVYSTRWVDLFKYYGIIEDTTEYNDLLASIEETTELNYTQNYYTKQAVQNTYNYLTNDNIDEVTSSGITSPETQEPDLSDAIDSVQSIFERYDEASVKQFTLRLPNGYTHIFAISPDILKNALIRVGGNDIIIIIQTLWYIGVYGLMIFAYLKIYGSVLGGNLDNIVGAFSPMTSVLHSSLEVTGAFSIGDSTSFISLTKKG